MKLDDSKKELKEFKIEVDGKSIKISPEKSSHWYRKVLNRETDSIMSDEILIDSLKIAYNLSEPDGTGFRKSKYNVFSFNLQANPKSSFGRSKQKYKAILLSEINRHSVELSKFKSKEVLVYMCIYLRPEKYRKNDVDNFVKIILDSLKEYIGDDRNVLCVIAEKKKLENYPDEDMDFLEQIVIYITDPSAKKDILK